MIYKPDAKSGCGQGAEQQELTDATLRRIMEETASGIKKPDPALLGRIERKIDQSRPGAAAVPRLHSWFRDLLSGLMTRPGLGWSLAGVQAAVFCLFLILAPAGNGLRTLSSPVVPQAGLEQHLYVVFDESARIKDIQELLTAARLQIVDGPNRKGVYTLRVPNQDNPDDLVARLRSRSLIRFIERAY